MHCCPFKYNSAIELHHRVLQLQVLVYYLPIDNHDTMKLIEAQLFIRVHHCVAIITREICRTDFIIQGFITNNKIIININKNYDHCSPNKTLHDTGQLKSFNHKKVQNIFLFIQTILLYQKIKSIISQCFHPFWSHVLNSFFQPTYWL